MATHVVFGSWMQNCWRGEQLCNRVTDRFHQWTLGTQPRQSQEI